jgi:hypothetical protein
MNVSHWWHRRVIDGYFAGRAGARDDARLRARLGRCDRCRTHYARHLVAEAALPGGDERALDRLWGEIRRASAPPAPAAAPRPRPVRARLALAGALLGAAAALVVAVRRPPDPVPRGVRDVPARAPSIHIFRSVSDHAVQPIERGPIHPDDGLLFAYSNPDPALTQLMVFAVDQAEVVRWYYPAYLRAGEDPASVPIVPGTVGTELGEEIRHPLSPGSVRVYALFSREPHHVLEIESMIRRLEERGARSPGDELHLPIGGSAQQSALLEVVP